MSTRTHSLVALALAAALLGGCQCGGVKTNNAQPSIEATPQSLDFGTSTPDVAVEKTVSLLNQGQAELVISSIAIAGESASQFSVIQPQSLRVESGGSLSVTLTYRPSGAGNHAARLMIESDASNAPELVVPLTGLAFVADPCAKVTCTTPPGPCFKERGTCSGGSCSYQPKTDGAACDDGNGCTVNDICGSSGSCSGTAKSCQAPPSPSCLDSQTLHSYDATGSCSGAGVCSYLSHDSICALGCDTATGQCRSTCPSGQHLCSGQCVFDTSVNSCGSSCKPCSAPTNATATCDGTSCGFTCDAGFAVCGSACCAGTAAVVAAGDRLTCALTVSGGVKCWGWTGPAADVPGLASGVVAISAGSQLTCALTKAGGVKCWGVNSHGQLGDGSYTNSATNPVDVSGLASGMAAVSAGSLHACALTTSGGVKCWGYNYYGQLGTGSASPSTIPTPVDVAGLTSGVAAVAVGEYYTCALTTSGGVKCWGYNWSGQLGNGTHSDNVTPSDVSGLTSGVAAIATGANHACALTTTGGVKCWGSNLLGSLGDGVYASSVPTPVNVFGLGSGVAGISLGGYSSCALTNSGAIKCWGRDMSGQLGDGSTTDRSTPVNVSGITGGMAGVSQGGAHACALAATGHLKCWGWNVSGQLGDGTTTDSLTPVDVIGF